MKKVLNECRIVLEHGTEWSIMNSLSALRTDESFIGLFNAGLYSSNIEVLIIKCQDVYVSCYKETRSNSELTITTIELNS